MIVNIPEIIGEIDQETAQNKLEDCIKARDVIIDELIDRADELPSNLLIFSCGTNDKNDPHFWLEIHLAGGQILVWDQIKQKLPENLTSLEEAQEKWSKYAKPDQRMQIIPLREE